MDFFFLFLHNICKAHLMSTHTIRFRGEIMSWLLLIAGAMRFTWQMVRFIYLFIYLFIHLFIYLLQIQILCNFQVGFLHIKPLLKRALL